MFRNRCGNTGDISFLEGVAPDEGRRYLAADDDEGDGIHVGRGNACNHVADARTGRSKADTGLARSAGITVSGVDSSLFVACQDMGKFGFI